MYRACTQYAVLNEQLRSPLQVASEKSTAEVGPVMTTTIEKLAGITAQHNEIVKRVVNGTLDADDVREALQLIIEKQYLLATHKQSEQWRPPTWYVSPERQLERARQLWPDIALPEPPKEFMPTTASEVLLLHVPRPFNELWDRVVAPEGYTKYRWDGLKTDKRNLRLAPNKAEYTEPVWLVFDPEHGKGTRPDSLWGQSNLAASEVFSALIQFPDWPLAWFNGASAPNLSGYQLKYDGNWSYVPYVHRWDDDRQLELNACWAGDRYDHWASPVVREC